MKQKHHSAGRRERKFRARQKVLKEIKVLVCSEKNSPKMLLVTLMFPRPLQWFPCWLAVWRPLPAHDTANPTVSHIIMVLDERKESFLTDPDAEQGRTVLGSSATWAAGGLGGWGVVLNTEGRFFCNRSGAGKLLFVIWPGPHARSSVKPTTTVISKCGP